MVRVIDYGWPRRHFEAVRRQVRRAMLAYYQDEFDWLKDETE